jgi:hypothetical protein
MRTTVLVADLRADEEGLRPAWETRRLDWRRALLDVRLERVTVLPVGDAVPTDPGHQTHRARR